MANINCFGAYIGSNGFYITTNSGEINISTVLINGTGLLGAKSSTMLTSSLGSVSLVNATVIDSEMSVSSQVSTVLLQNVQK